MLLSWTEETFELTGGAAAPCATLDAPIEDDAGFDDDDEEGGWGEEDDNKFAGPSALSVSDNGNVCSLYIYIYILLSAFCNIY